MLDSIISEEIFQRVETLRKKQNLTLYALAKKATVSPSSLYRWRDRKSSPTLYLLEMVADALHVSLIYLMFNAEKVEYLTPAQKDLLQRWERLSVKQKFTVDTVIDSWTDV